MFLSGFQFTLTLSKGLRISETFSGLSHTLPSKTGSFRKTLQGRNTEALCRFLGDSIHHLFERTGLFLHIRDGELLFFWRQLRWSATAGLIMQTAFTLMCPFLDPCGDGVAINVIHLGDFIDRHPLSTA